MGEQKPEKQFTSLPDGAKYNLLKPIPFEVKPAEDEEDPHYIASAPELGLLVTGAGDTPEAAQADLMSIILDQADDFQTEKNFVEYALTIKKIFAEYLSPIE